MKLLLFTVRIAESMKQLRGWRRLLLSCLAGIFATLALPPIFLTFMILPAFSIFVLLLYGAESRKQAFSDGWGFGVGFFTSGLYWVTISLFTDISQFWWLVPFALFGLPMVLSIYIGLFGLCMFYLRRQGVFWLLWFAALWVLFEMLRGWLFTGFPWNLIGYVWTVSVPTMQLASVLGIYGLSWITIMIAASPALIVLHPERANHYIRTFLFLCAICVFIGAWGVWRAESNPTQYTETSIRIVQANIEQSLKWHPNERQKNFEKHIQMSQFETNPVDIVVWPETAYPYYLKPDREDVGLWQHIIPSGTVLITGGVRIMPSSEDFDVWNSLVVVDSKGEYIGQYDKNHLVPFGEYVPFRKFLPLPKITQGSIDFSTGNGYNIVDTKVIPPFAALICYEAIFPGKAVIGEGHPKWIVNITNDAWFGNSSGPYQHLHAAQMRAVEQGVPLVRAANTGVSAIIDPLGRILKMASLNNQSTVDSKLPKELEESTVYQHLSGNIVIILIFTILIFGEFIRKKVSN